MVPTYGMLQYIGNPYIIEETEMRCRVHKYISVERKSLLILVVASTRYSVCSHDNIHLLYTSEGRQLAHASRFPSF